MKRAIGFIIALTMMLTACFASSAEYAFSFSDSIPKEVQHEAVQYMIETISKTSKETHIYSYAELLDLYLKFYGIYGPVSINSLADWAQKEIANNEDRIELIPERYTKQGDLSAWVTRYAQPGDLLLYRINGKADKCVVYSGNGKMIGRGPDGNKEMDIRATFAEGESFRTKSGGLYAIAHMWAEEKEESKYIDVQIRIGGSHTSFTQKHYTIWEKTENGYIVSGRFVLVENQPGVYKIWNGESFGIAEDMIEENGIELILTASEAEKSQMNKQIKIQVTKEELQQIKETGNYEYTIEINEETRNSFQWSGADLMEAIKKEGSVVE